MQTETKGMELTALLKQYNHEIDRLKSKLLCGASWEEVAPTRKKITELAVAIHQVHHHKQTENSPANLLH